MASKAPFAWYGGKQYLVPVLLELLPPHDVYIEVFGGAASLLFAKPPAKLEVYNDIDDGLVNFFRVLRDRKQAKELQRLLRLTPYARSEWAECVAGWQDAPSALECARQWYVAVQSSFGHHLEQSGWSYCLAEGMRSCKATSLHNTAAQLHVFTERMQSVQVDHLDALDVLRRYDAPEVLFYLDPPYIVSTRGHRVAYRHEMSDGDHQRLLQVLPALRGKVILSGYRHPIYDEALVGWRRVDRQMAHSTSLTRNARRRYVTECIWLSPKAMEHQPELPFQEVS